MVYWAIVLGLGAISIQMWGSWLLNEFNWVVNLGGFSFFSPWHRSDYFRNFVDSCLQKIPQDRPTSEELLKVGLPVLSVFHVVLKGAVPCDDDLSHLLYKVMVNDAQTPLSWECCGVYWAGSFGFTACLQCLRVFPRCLSKPALEFSS